MLNILIIMAIGFITVGLFLALLYGWQNSIILQPGIGGGSRDVLALCTPGSAVWPDHGKYRGKICEPANAAKGTVIVYHGNAGTVDDRSALVDVLTLRGYRTVLVEYPGFGAREGSATINSALSASMEDFRLAYATWPAPIYVLGESFGAGIAAEVAGNYREKVAGLVLITPWDSLANVVNAKFLHLPIGFLLHQRFDTVAALSAYPGNVVIVGAERDEVIPVSHARALAKAVPAAAYQEIRGAGHNSWPMVMTQADWDRVTESLTRPR
ncbi:MAG: alpha/beta hydrolase [Herminiimonas sp.]|nr:alpha/beta hydrolase [Herminiimonas sp.]